MFTSYVYAQQFTFCVYRLTDGRMATWKNCNEKTVVSITITEPVNVQIKMYINARYMPTNDTASAIDISNRVTYISRSNFIVPVFWKLLDQLAIISAYLFKRLPVIIVCSFIVRLIFILFIF